MKLNKKIAKKISLSFVIFILIIPVIAILGQFKFKSQTPELEIPTNHKVKIDKLSDQQQISAKYLNKLVETTFKTNQLAKDKFLKSQEQATLLFNQLKQITDQNKVNDFINKNWLFVLKNIDKFQLKFKDYWTLNEYVTNINQAHSSSFINKIDELKNTKHDDIDLKQNYFDFMHLGEESQHNHGPNYSFYLRLDKLAIRILISRDKDKNDFKFDKFIYFNKAQNNNFTVLIAQVIHQIIHRDNRAIQTFEDEIVSNYGFATLNDLVLRKDDNNEK
ncbi:aromatic motif membrane protein [Mycoplasma yeatsii]|uniref:Aromatic cluster surface protein n=1 Tax=Mycoplasma yeatsii TaxID=51365 RepID=A0ABU0NE67_9MOLU|nr:aromatic motif membrane protein [Mycoplasma yeatsii]MDQ0567741.1 aromatic cluster surface protein [Mycoplasma yeatsii]